MDVVIVDELAKAFQMSVRDPRAGLRLDGDGHVADDEVDLDAACETPVGDVGVEVVVGDVSRELVVDPVLERLSVELRPGSSCPRRASRFTTPTSAK